jgi:predicted DNA-binding transcriptional regulator AlpA
VSNSHQARQNAGAGGAPVPRLLTERDLAEWLSVSIKSLQRWRMFRRGPAFLKLGSGLVRYSTTEVEAWLARCREEQRGAGR